jgi:hypothetical protein
MENLRFRDRYRPFHDTVTRNAHRDDEPFFPLLMTPSQRTRSCIDDIIPVNHFRNLIFAFECHGEHYRPNDDIRPAFAISGSGCQIPTIDTVFSQAAHGHPSNSDETRIISSNCGVRPLTVETRLGGLSLSKTLHPPPCVSSASLFASGAVPETRYIEVTLPTYVLPSAVFRERNFVSRGLQSGSPCCEILSTQSQIRLENHFGLAINMSKDIENSRMPKPRPRSHHCIGKIFGSQDATIQFGCMSHAECPFAQLKTLSLSTIPFTTGRTGAIGDISSLDGRAPQTGSTTFYPV